MVFVFDLDDTICDTDRYSEIFIRNFIKKHNLPFKQIAKNVRFAEMKFDWSHEDALSWYKKYGDEMFLHFPVKGNSVDVINELYDAGHTIIISTARATDWHVEPNKKTLEWLNKVGLKYHKIYIGRQDKEKICDQEGADVFVDDDINIISRVNEFFKSKNKGKVYLSATNYNQTLEIPSDIHVIKTLDEMLEDLNINTQNNY